MAAPKNVTNPMTAYLDGGGNSIGNIVSLSTSSGAAISGSVVTAPSIDVSDPAQQIAAPQIRAGQADPSLGLVGRIGSLYLRNDLAGTGSLWLKTGPSDTDWTRLG